MQDCAERNRQRKPMRNTHEGTTHPRGPIARTYIYVSVLDGPSRCGFALADSVCFLLRRRQRRHRRRDGQAEEERGRDNGFTLTPGARAHTNAAGGPRPRVGCFSAPVTSGKAQCCAQKSGATERANQRRPRGSLSLRCSLWRRVIAEGARQAAQEQSRGNGRSRERMPHRGSISR